MIKDIKNFLVKEALREKMEKLGAKLQKYASVYWGEEIVIIYAKKSQIKDGRKKENNYE